MKLSSSPFNSDQIYHIYFIFSSSKIIQLLASIKMHSRTKIPEVCSSSRPMPISLDLIFFVTILIRLTLKRWWTRSITSKWNDLGISERNGHRSFGSTICVWKEKRHEREIQKIVFVIYKNNNNEWRQNWDNNQLWVFTSILVGQIFFVVFR